MTCTFTKNLKTPTFWPHFAFVVTRCIRCSCGAYNIKFSTRKDKYIQCGKSKQKSNKINGHAVQKNGGINSLFPYSKNGIEMFYYETLDEI